MYEFVFLIYALCPNWVQIIHSLLVQELELRFYPIMEAAQTHFRSRTTWTLAGGKKITGSERQVTLRPIHVLDTATLAARGICEWRVLCPAMQYMRQSIAQYLVHMCPDDVDASQEHRAASEAGSLQLSPAEIEAYMELVVLKRTPEGWGEISAFNSIVVHNEVFSGYQKLRCFPFGEGYQFHKKNIQDTIFAIPARKSTTTFDISDPTDERELVFGRLYCIFRIFLYNEEIEGGDERDLALIKVHNTL